MKPFKFACAAVVLMATVPVAAADSAAGGTLVGQRGCVACHGDKGQGGDLGPRLAGQHASYIRQALLEYKLKKRKNPIMQGQGQALTTAEMADIASYYSKLPGLVTPTIKAQ